ncbi:unnamed protein product [Cylindrotheca closterium]|uniref:Uncharacterized protein n=1 Tax=Cylindrotheca closterium TaxID=2856 RepID=A0AAD2G721_9STRA|nr:unnamed protein product [Cylindrotheca closterium]
MRSQQDKPQQQKPRPRNIFQQQRDERSTSSTEKSSLYNYTTDYSSQHTQQTEVRTNLSKPSLFEIAESSGATLAAAAISPFDEDRRGSREHRERSFFEEHDDDNDDLRESPSDELPLNVVEKAIDRVLDATCGNVTDTSGLLVGSLLPQSYLETEGMMLDEDGIIDPIIPNPFEGLRQEVRPVYEPASFPKVSFREVKLDPKKTVASTAMQYPESPRPMIKPKVPNKTSASPTKVKSPIRSMANRVKSVQNKLFRRKNRPSQESNTKKAEYLNDKRASKLDRYTRARAHSDTSDSSRSWVKHHRRPLDCQDSREDTTTKSYSTSTDDYVSATMALHECPSVRDERTNRAQHNRSSRRRMQSDETDTSDPSLPPRLPLHKNRLRNDNPSDEVSGAHHNRTVNVPSTDGSSFGFGGSENPYSSVVKCGSSSNSSSTSVSNDLIPQVSDYILPQGGSRRQTDIKEQISMLLQEQAIQVERIAIIRDRRIQSDPAGLIAVDEIGKRSDPPAVENETTVLRKTIKRRRAVSQPSPHSHYQRMAQFFVPVLFRILSKYQRKSLEFNNETATAVVLRYSSSQEYVLSELVNVAVLLMQQSNSETVKNESKQSSRKHRRKRRRKRSSVLDELCNQISVLDQKLLEITSDTAVNDNAAIEDQEALVDSEETPFIEQIDDWSDDRVPPEVEGLLEETNHVELFAELQTNDPEFKDLVEAAYVITDLSRDEFIDAHHSNSMEGDEDDDMEQELTNLSFVEEIIQSELSQVDSGEGTYQAASLVEGIFETEVSPVSFSEGTYQDKSFVVEIVETDVSPVSSSEGTYQDESFVEEIVEIEVSPITSSEGTDRDESFVEEIVEIEVSPVSSSEGTDQDESFVEEIVEVEVSPVDSSKGIYQGESFVEEIIEIEASPAVSSEMTRQEDSVIVELSSIGPGEGVYLDESVVETTGEAKVSRVASSERDHEEQLVVEAFMNIEASHSYSIEGIHQKDLIVEDTIEREVSKVDAAKRTVTFDIETENQETKDSTPPAVERETRELSKIMCLEAAKESPWENNMFPDDELQLDAIMFPEDEMDMFPDDEMSSIDQLANAATPIAAIPMYTSISRQEQKCDDIWNLIAVPTHTTTSRPKLECGKDWNEKEDDDLNFPDLLSLPSDEREAVTKPSCSYIGPKYISAATKERSSFKGTHVPREVEGTGEQLASGVSLSSRFMTRQKYKNEAISRAAAHIPREKEPDTISIPVDGIPKEREMVSLQPALVIPAGGDQDDTTLESMPSDEASEGISETESVGAGELADTPKQIKRNGVETSVVECIDENPAVELVVAPTSPVLSRLPDSKQTMQQLETTRSCETEESDPICAAVDRKLAEVRQNGIPDPDDEMIMESIGMSLSMNSASKTPKSTASGVVPDPDDDTIMETFLSPSGSFRRNDSKRVDESDANNKIVMETVYLAESEMVTEKLFTVSEEGTTSSSPCNASRQTTATKEKDRKLEESHTLEGQVRAAIVKFNGVGCSTASSHIEAGVGSQDNRPALASSPSHSIKSKRVPRVQSLSKNRSPGKQSKPNGSHSKVNAAALIARFEAATSPKNILGVDPVVLEDEGDMRASAVSTLRALACDTPATNESEDIVIEGFKHSHPNEKDSLEAQSTNECDSPVVKLSSEPRQGAFYDKIPNLLSLSSQSSQPKVSKTGHSGKCGGISNSPSKGESKGESKGGSKINRIRSQFESNVSMKKDRPTDTSPCKKLGYKGVRQNDQTKPSKLHLKLPTNKQLPLHGFVEAASRKDGSKNEPLIDKVKPPVHQQSKNFPFSPLDVEALNESLLQIHREEKDNQRDRLPEHQDDEDTASDNDESTALPIRELQLKEIPSLVSELDVPRVTMFSSGMCNCLGAVEGKSSNGDNSIEQLKKIGRQKKDQAPVQVKVSNLDEFVPNVFSMDGMLDDNMQRTADAAVKALELVLAKGAANAATAAAAITQNESQPSCFKDCMTPMTEGSFNAFSQAVIPKTANTRMLQQGNEYSLTPEDDKSKGKEDTRNDAQLKSTSKETARSPRKKPLHDFLAVTDIHEYDDTDDWARIAIEENNVDDLIESLRSKSSELDPFMNVSFDPSTPMTNRDYVSRKDTPFSPISSDWTGSAGRLGVHPVSVAQRDAWSKRNLLSGTTTFSSEEGSEHYLQPHSQQSEDGGDFDARKVDIDFHFESPASSIRGPYDRMIKKQVQRGRTPTSRTRTATSRTRTATRSRTHTRSIDPLPSGRLEREKGSISTRKREPAAKKYNRTDQHGVVTGKKQERPDYYDFPAPPSLEISELTMSEEGDTALMMKSQDHVKALKSFQERENRVGGSSEWLYDSKRGTRTATAKQGVGVDKEPTSSSSMWCSESLGTMIQDCFPTSQPTTTTKTIKEAPPTEVVATPPERRRKRAPDAPPTGP